MDDLWHPNLGESESIFYIKKKMKINRDSLLFVIKKQEFNAHKNTLRRLINQAKPIILNNLTERNVTVKRHGTQLTRHSIGKHQNPLPML